MQHFDQWGYGLPSISLPAVNEPRYKVTNVNGIGQEKKLWWDIATNQPPSTAFLPPYPTHSTNCNLAYFMHTIVQLVAAVS